MVLKNPDMELAAADLEWQIKQAQANYDNLKVQLETQQLAQKATTEQVKSDMDQAELQADRDTQLTKLGLKSDLDTKLVGGQVAGAKGALRSVERTARHQQPVHQSAIGCTKSADREAACCV